MKTTNVLIVDDNASLAAAFELLLSGQGFHVTTARSGNEAIKVFRGCQMDRAFAIVDLKMPDWDGPTTIKALQENSPDLLVIAVSGQMLSPYFARLADLGVRHFLPKPFRFEELLETIRDVQEAA